MHLPPPSLPARCVRVAAASGVKSVQAGRVAFRPQQGRRQMSVMAAADGEHCMHRGPRVSDQQAAVHAARLSKPTQPRRVRASPCTMRRQTQAQHTHSSISRVPDVCCSTSAVNERQADCAAAPAAPVARGTRRPRVHCHRRLTRHWPRHCPGPGPAGSEGELHAW